MLNALVALVFGTFLSAALAVSPYGCMVEDVVGNWTLYMDEGGHDEYYNCAYMTDYVSTFNMELLFPNKVVDMYGNEGTWTMVDSYGFEAVVHGRKYYAPIYTEDITYFCNRTSTGYSHDIMNRNWFCYKGKKNGPSKNVLRMSPLDWSDNEELDHMMYKVDESVIERVNSDNNILWYAKKYEQYEKMTVGQMKRLMGQNKGMRTIKPSYGQAMANQELKDKADKLPEHFDWRNVDGVNYISPVRHQGHCGSCYAFASVGMNEARLNIASRGRINVTLSPQDVVECSMYTAGCGGGFEYLAAGKYAEDHGMVEESCYPYRAADGRCKIEKRDKCKKHYFTDYEYVGGFFGVCNEEAMKVALMHGPITVAIQSSKDLKHYAGGIYHQTNFELNPYYPTNHAVLIVGYGVQESTNTKFWIVKNSWGDKWGEQGYFRIRRGTNEIGIETSAFQAFPIF